MFEKTESVADHELIARVNFDHHDLAAADEWGRRALDTMRKRRTAPSDFAGRDARSRRRTSSWPWTRRKKRRTLLRECLAIRTDALSPDNWLVAETKSLLGDCLARRGLYAEAEPLLIESLSTDRDVGTVATAEDDRGPGAHRWPVRSVGGKACRSAALGSGAGGSAA